MCPFKKYIWFVLLSIYNNGYPRKISKLRKVNISYIYINKAYVKHFFIQSLRSVGETKACMDTCSVYLYLFPQSPLIHFINIYRFWCKEVKCTSQFCCVNSLRLIFPIKRRLKCFTSRRWNDLCGLNAINIIRKSI
jgi:hypothetical protein